MANEFETPGKIIGYRKNGMPIKLIAGGAPEDDDEGTPAPTKRSRAKDEYTREEFEAALAAEREKLTSKLSKTEEKYSSFEEELKSLRQFQKAAEKEKAQREAELEAARKAAEEEKMTAQQLIEARSKQWEQQLADMQRKQEEQTALFAKEREFTQLQIYIRDQIATHQDDIMDELLDYIGGNTKEEVDQAIAVALQKSASVAQKLQELQVNGRAAQQGTRSGPVPIGELDRPAGDGQVDIASMSMAEYAKFRQGRIPQTGTGIFG